MALQLMLLQRLRISDFSTQLQIADCVFWVRLELTSEVFAVRFCLKKGSELKRDPSRDAA